MNIFEMKPCDEAMEWVWTMIGSGADTQTIWDTCPRGDWMLWLLGKLAGPPGSDSRRQLAYCAAECAALVLPIWEERYPDDDRPRKAIEAAKNGDPYAADAAAYAADAAADAAYAAYAAAAAAAAAGAAAAAAPASSPATPYTATRRRAHRSASTARALLYATS